MDREEKRFLSFSKSRYPKENVIACLECEFTYYDVAVLHVSHDTIWITTRLLGIIIRTQIIIGITVSFIFYSFLLAFFSTLRQDPRICQVFRLPFLSFRPVVIRGFHWSLSVSKSPQVPWTLRSILADPNNTVVLILSLIFYSFLAQAVEAEEYTDSISAKRKDFSNECLIYDTKQSDGEALVVGWLVVYFFTAYKPFSDHLTTN